MSALGVNAIGLNFYPASPRGLSLGQAADLLTAVDAELQVYALFVDPSIAEVEAVLGLGRVDHLQFHGSEPPDFCAAFGLPYMKACRVRDEATTLAEIDLHNAAESILLDSYDKQAAGGTGKTFDWQLAARLVAACDKPVVLAGGLTPGNVAEAIGAVNPYGVDVSSGVESAPGIKDLNKLKLFVEGVRSARS